MHFVPIKGLYFSDNQGNKSFDSKQWEAIKTWTSVSKGNSISKEQAENMYKYIRELKHFDFRTNKFWKEIPSTQFFTFDSLSTTVLLLESNIIWENS